jgi:predicted nuclease with RNAse H fold
VRIPARWDRGLLRPTVPGLEAVTARASGRTWAGCRRFVSVLSSVSMTEKCRVLGIDLASQPANTAACVLSTGRGALEVVELRVGCTDGELLSLAQSVDVVAIDSPFGWPTAFTRLIARHAEPESVGSDGWSWDGPTQGALRLRETDIWVWKNVLRRSPLSVSTDKIALPAMRCTGLLSALKVRDRSGDGRVYEVYPAAALERWVGLSSGYKNGPAAMSQLATIVDALECRLQGWRLPERCRVNDDALDAVVSAFVGAAARIGAVEPVPMGLRSAAAIEGWIAVPTADALTRLLSSVDPSN